MTELGVVMNRVTGRMGYRQHLVRSVLAINAEGGVTLADGSRVRLRPVLVGRSEAKLKDLAARHDIADWTTDLDTALSDAANTVYFDAQITQARVAATRKAIAAGKHVYCEKPTAETSARRPSTWPRRPRPRGSRTASSRTSCSCRAC